MSSNYIDSILPKYQADSAANLVNYNSQARSMYPYVSVTSHQLSANAPSNMSPFSAMTATTDAEKQCRYSQTGATDMSQYGLNLQNCATTSNMAQYFHQNNATNPLNSCSQPTAPTPHIPDIPRYPWMSITETAIGTPLLVLMLCQCFSASQKLFPHDTLQEKTLIKSFRQGVCFPHVCAVQCLCSYPMLDHLLSCAAQACHLVNPLQRVLKQYESEAENVYYSSESDKCK
nr:homeobox protein abdominal-A homolog [Penaeus vannamei]